MMTPLDLIDLPARNVRRVPATPAEDRALIESVRTLGVLQPVLLRPSAASNGRFVVVAGARRVMAARAADLTSIPAEIRKGTEDGRDVVDAVAENSVRVGMAPVDLWRAMVRLQEEGHTLDHCAVALGMTKAMARRIDRLGRLHPDVIAAIEAYGLPDSDELRVITLAPLEVQAQAVQQLRPSRDDDADDEEDEGRLTAHWYSVASACSSRRISSKLAIFEWRDGTMVFDEDLFAPEDHPEHWTTLDVAGFLEMQRATLEARLAGDKRSMIVTSDHLGAPMVPKGWQAVGFCDWPDTKVLKRGHCRAWAIAQDGYYIGRVRGAVIAKAADAPAPPVEEADAGDDADTLDGHGHADTAEDSAPTVEPEDKARLTKAGEDMVAAAKTDALRARLRAHGGEMETELLLALLVIALTAATVQVMAEPGSSYGRTRFTDLLPDLVRPDGRVMLYGDVRSVAAEAIARMLICPGAGLRPDTAAEWIGNAIDAEHALGRFDTPEFLAQCRMPALKGLASVVDGSGAYKTAKGLREYLAGKDATWMPLEAIFDAPGPEARL